GLFSPLLLNVVKLNPGEAMFLFAETPHAYLQGVALEVMANSDIAAKGVLPTCQDTGTAIIVGKKGQRVWTGGGDEAALARG
ncbi:fumarate hydratase, partial [Escherichia coli]|nr:fumarate hydratase [Escherichia coli]